MKKTSILLQVFIISLFLTPTNLAFAQNEDFDLENIGSSSFAINPAYAKMRDYKADYQAHQGDTIEDSFYIHNLNEEKTIDLKIQALDYVAANDGSFGLKANTANQEGVGKWVEILGPDEISLAPKETKEIKIKLNVPLGVKPGEYKGALAARTKPLGQYQGLDYNIQIASRIYLQVVPDTVPIAASIVNFDIEAIERANFKRNLFYLSLGVSGFLVISLVGLIIYSKKKKKA